MQSISPSRKLPFDPFFEDEENYVKSLLSFVTSSQLFQRLCGGVHVLDFLTKDPSLFNSVLPTEWIEWFGIHEVCDALDILLHEDDSLLHSLLSECLEDRQEKSTWRGRVPPPKSLLEYIITIRKHSLRRGFDRRHRCEDRNSVLSDSALKRRIAIGMKPKKIHEVEHFIDYIGDLTDFITSSTPHHITHLIDFGSGKNYLGRALADCLPEQTIIALESKQLNIEGAKSMDITAKLVEKEKNDHFRRSCPSPAISELPAVDAIANMDWSVSSSQLNIGADMETSTAKSAEKGRKTRIFYVHTMIENGNLSNIFKAPSLTSSMKISSSHSLVISLHSCGNLLHHGLRSLVLNPTVKAVAMVGCCHNLLSERLRPQTFKLPHLRSASLRPDKIPVTADPHGFPMSERLATYKHEHGQGVLFNITARMLAVQSPRNWSDSDCESFFTRHFYRALLQKIFLDRRLIPKPWANVENFDDKSSNDPPATAGETPITIGSLRKACYISFQAYVHGAVQKLSQGTDAGRKVAEGMRDVSDAEIAAYEERHKDEKKNLSILWTLMAFSAGVVESVIAVDRWQYLREQPEVKQCWVETVFDYKHSPRNLVVVGIKH